MVRGDLSLTLYTDGRYELKVNDLTWLMSSPKTFLRSNGQLYVSSEKTLVLNGTYASSGQDQLGAYQSMMFDYAAFDDPNTRVECSVITYRDYDMVRFQQVDKLTNDFTI